MLRWLASISCLCLLALAPSARAQDLDDPYFGVALTLGFAGEAEVKSASTTAENLGITVEGDGETAEADMEVSFGGAIQYIYPLHRYFALGGRLGALSWRSDAGEGDRNLVFDLAIVPQLRLPLSAAVELYLGVPIGLSLDLLNELDRSVGGAGASASVEADAGIGFNLAALLGARFALAREVGLFTEFGYSLHSVSHDIHFRGGIAGAGIDVTAEIDLSWWQLAWNVGVYF